jgi:hypothetical protein
VEAHFGCGLRRHAASGPIGGRYDRALSGGVLSGAASSRPQGKRMASALGGGFREYRTRLEFDHCGKWGRHDVHLRLGSAQTERRHALVEGRAMSKRLA